MNKEVWWFLQRMKKELLLTTEKGVIRIGAIRDQVTKKISTLFQPEYSGEEILNETEQHKIINKLITWGLFKEGSTVIAGDYTFVVDEKKFDEIYEKYEKTFPAHESETKETNILYLSHDGDLWRKPKEKYCYQMGEKSDRYKMLRYLVTNRGYQETPSISRECGDKNLQTVRTEIGKINENATQHLKIKKLILGRKESGYKISEQYKVVLVK